MTHKILPKLKQALFVAALSVLLASCNLPSDRAAQGGSSSPSNTPPGAYPVDPIFEEFYTYLGGFETLGPAISPLQHSAGQIQQYVQSGLMVYDPQATPSERYRLAPLASGFEVSEPPLPEPRDPGQRIVSGHTIYPDFLPLYEALGGARYVGRPLTEARHNPEKRRIEQYFENLGFYLLDDDLNGKAHLLAYGVLACDYDCRYRPRLEAIPENAPPLPEPFASKVSMLGLPFVGLTLSEPYKAPDGKLEVIFENVVLAADYEGASHAFARPIVEMVGIPAQPMGECHAGGLMVCFPADGKQGHPVPVYFRDYILQHGGWDLFGMPATEVFPAEDNVFRQCFTNLCLDFDLSGSDQDKLRPVALGKLYKEQVYESFRRDEFEESYKDLRIHITEKQAMVASGQPQEIDVLVTEQDVPLANREPLLTLTLPDGNTENFHFPPSDSRGMTSLTLPPIEAPNGTLIPYEVCLTGVYGKTFCIGEHYLIWNLP